MDENTSKRRRFPFPLDLLALDFLGSVLAALGIMELFNPPGLFVPETLRFPFYPWVLIGLGALLIIPLVSHIVRNAQQQGTSKASEGPRRR